MRLVLSRFALAELDEILGYISERSPLGAKHVEARVRRAFDHIAQYPEAAERLEQRPGVRRLPLARYPYVIYYEIGPDVVTVLRILHGARRQPWGDEDTREGQ
jgi:plasmid stabilization system protein ParE